jgi:Tol biopolymer transport system component
VVVLTLAGGARSVVADGGPDALPSDAGWSPDGTKLIYDRLQVDVTGRPTAASIWTVGVDGTGDAQLAGLPPTAGEPAWSGADVIAFDDGLNIFTVPAAGGTPTKVTNLSATSQQANRSPRWTPDGRISFVHEPTNGTNVLMSVAADGGDPAVIFSSGGRVYPERPAARP